MNRPTTTTPVEADHDCPDRDGDGAPDSPEADDAANPDAAEAA